MDLPEDKTSNMPLLKNISVKSIKSAGGGGVQSLSVGAITATATGSAGYFTSSIINGINRIYTGATYYDPNAIYITFSTSSVTGGTGPYTCKWTSSKDNYPAYSGYTQGTVTGSMTTKAFSGDFDRWTVTVTDSATPPNIATASIDSIIYGNDFEIFVGTWFGVTGSDTQVYDPVVNYFFPGGLDLPLATIGAGLLYCVPGETFINVASGTYAETPVISKIPVTIDGTADTNGNPAIASGSYFVYGTKISETGSFRSPHPVTNTPVIRGFLSSSFDIIGVNTSGSIQGAVFDVQPSGTIQILGGVHEINTPISTSYGKQINFRGVHVPTGSNDTYYYQPQSILRRADSSFPIFATGVATPNNTGSAHTVSNLALEKSVTGSFFTISANDTRNYILEMVRFRIITGSVAQEMYTWGNATGGSIPFILPNSGSTTGNGMASPVRPLVSPNIINIYAHINDIKYSGFGSGQVIAGVYSPYPSSNSSSYSTLVPRHDFWEFANNSGPAGALISTIENISGVGAVAITNGLTDPTKPVLSFSSSFYNENYYGNFNGINQNLEVNWGGFQHTGSYIVGIFTSHAVSQSRQVVFKVGDETKGTSVVVTGSQVCLTIYNNVTSPTGSVFMLTDITTNQQYMAEIFFDGTSTNKRVGMALYGTSSLITSSYFSSTNFAPSSFGLPVIGTTNRWSIGCAVNRYRTLNTLSTATGRRDHFNGTVAMVSYVQHQRNFYNDARQTSFYRTMRAKYFSSSSIVQRGISQDN